MRSNRIPHVLVLGAGVVGLNTALRLSSQYPVTIMADQFGLQTDSRKATAIWHLYLVPEAPTILAWAAETLVHLITLAGNPTSGVTMLSGTELFRGRATEQPLWAGIPPMFHQLSDEEIRQYNQHKGDHLHNVAMNPVTSGYSLQVPGADMNLYLPWLERQVSEHGCHFLQSSVNRFEDISSEYDLIVNCTGLGARELANDRTFVPYKGQYFVFNRTTETPPQYIGDDDHPGGMAYVIPRGTEVLVGGCADEGLEDLGFTLSWEDVRERAGLYMPWLRSLSAKDQARPPVVGIRPARRGGVRLEIDTEYHDRLIIHNYGHGGSGFSLAWGCAGEVLRLINMTRH